MQNRRFVKVKNSKREFLCALCRALRALRYSKNLSRANYLQIAMISIALSWCLYPFMDLKAGFSVFVVWPTFEMFNKFLYRKDLPCPYCGFDATWYRRDVKMARQKVAEFWAQNPHLNPQKTDKSAQQSAQPITQ